VTVGSASTVACLLTLSLSRPTRLCVRVAPARRPGLDITERLEIRNNTVPLAAQEIVGPDGDRQHLITALPGDLSIAYEGTAVRTAAVAAQPVSTAELVEAVRPSRYCPSDRMAGFARGHFGEIAGEMDRVRAICDYVWRHVTYETDTSDPGTDAVGTLLSGRGVCRDFAHLVTALCRGVEIPARIAAVYAPGLSPMDFHAVVETAVGGHWYVWDATRLAPRPTLLRIGTGRDAADVAFSTVISGQADLSALDISATASGDLPVDDHDEPVPLG
jgi:transglutaminase-like putative cysteine protease